VGFWQSMVHVVRNAVDHGLEAKEARSAAGKPEVGRIRLRTRMETACLQVWVEDDGAGIDWERVRQLAHKRGLPSQTHDELVSALLSDGMTTRSEVSHVSGRGVGLSAVRDACTANGGSISVQSQPGRGTSFCFSFHVGAAGLPVTPTEVGDGRAAKSSNARSAQVVGRSG
jgi:two-component system chemotaxis sensor kinase CheA